VCDRVIDVGTTLTEQQRLTLRDQVRDNADVGTTIRVRLSRVRSFDTAGLGVLVGLRRVAAADHAHVVFADTPPDLLAALRQTGLGRVLDLQIELDLTARAGPST
jgi:anti-anti-sigma factor